MCADNSCQSNMEQVSQPTRRADFESPEEGCKNPTAGSPIRTRAAGVVKADAEANAITLTKTQLSSVSAGTSPNLQGIMAMI